MMTSNKPIISIIVPVYNVETYIDKCIESLLAQSYENIEIIIVDDGSTDSSGAIADQYAESYNNIITIHQKNGGLSKARNTGITASNGEWIAFVDSDDYVDKHYITKLYEAAIKYKADISACIYDTVIGNKKQSSNFYWPQESLTGIDALKNTLKNNNWPTCVWLYLYKSSIFKNRNVRFPDGKDYEDISTKIKTLYYANKVTYINEVLYHYTERGESITHKAFNKKVYDDKLYAAKDVDIFLDNMKPKEITEYKYYYMYYVINSILNDMSKTNAPYDDTKTIWKDTRTILANLYPKVIFPNYITRVKRGLLLLVSYNQKLYYIIYNRYRKNKFWV